MCRSQQGKRKLVDSKTTDRCGDVVENKGPLWKTGGQSGNVYENKDSYKSKPGMLLKTIDLVFGWESASKRQQRFQVRLGMAEARALLLSRCIPNTASD
jgi:hypothetical protein